MGGICRGVVIFALNNFRLFELIVTFVLNLK